MSGPDLDLPSRYTEIRGRIEAKPALKALYEETYVKYRDVLARAPQSGLAIELGSGAGFVKQALPEVLATDIIDYPGLDKVVDATKLPFGDQTVRALFLNNVLHHIPDASAFFREASRVLVPGGRIYICDQYPGWISRPILKYLHHEPFEDQSDAWVFPTTGPLSGANGALPWKIFFRDRARFERDFPYLRIASLRIHSPLRYWLSGGLKRWSLLPAAGFRVFTWIDQMLVKVSPQLGSFFDVEVEKYG